MLQCLKCKYEICIFICRCLYMRKAMCPTLLTAWVNDVGIRHGGAMNLRFNDTLDNVHRLAWYSVQKPSSNSAVCDIIKFGPKFVNLLIQDVRMDGRTDDHNSLWQYTIRKTVDVRYVGLHWEVRLNEWSSQSASILNDLLVRQQLLWDEVHRWL